MNLRHTYRTMHSPYIVHIMRANYIVSIVQQSRAILPYVNYYLLYTYTHRVYNIGRNDVIHWPKFTLKVINEMAERMKTIDRNGPLSSHYNQFVIHLNDNNHDNLWFRKMVQETDNKRKTIYFILSKYASIRYFCFISFSDVVLSRYPETEKYVGMRNSRPDFWC